MRCHACGVDGDARGPFGTLCAYCWERTLLVVERVIGHVSRWRS